MEELIEQYRKGQISRNQLEKALQEEWQKLDLNSADHQDYYRPEMLEFILSNNRNQAPVVKMHWWKYVAAASIIAFLALGGYLLFKDEHKTQGPNMIATVTDFPPGKQGAILTLANGSTVLLDSVQNGVVALQGGATAKVDDGKLIYEGVGNEAVFNTITTPRGRQFTMDLPDGSHVWLNAASSITYPTVFSGNDRQIKITGEVYIDVAKNPKKPFRVSVNNRNEVEVLGTSFNVEAYDDDVIKTTLLEGAVRVSSDNLKTSKSILLKPGQQAKSENEELQIVNDVDVNKVIAWKRGVFNFDDADLHTIMKQLARWYDMDIEYEGTVPAKTFRGEISRNVPVSKVLEILAYTGVHFKIEGKRLIVTP